MISVLAVACVAGLCPRWVHEGTAASAALRHVPPARWSRATPGADPEKPAASSGRRGPVVSTGDPWPPPVEPEQRAARRSAEDVWDARWPESTGTVLNTTRRSPGGQRRWPGSHEPPWSEWRPLSQNPGRGARDALESAVLRASLPHRGRSGSRAQRPAECAPLPLWRTSRPTPPTAQQGGSRRSRPAVSDGRDQISVSGSPDRSRCPRAGWPRPSPCRARGSRSRRTRSSGTARPSPLRSARR